MKGLAQTVLFMGVFWGGLIVPFSSAMVLPISSVEAGQDGISPYLVQTITVGGFIVSVNQLVTGTSTGSAAAGTVITNADDYDLDTIVIRTPRSDPIWQIVQFGGWDLWNDTNGSHPDFFLFEVGMNESFSVQAILSDGQLGQSIDIGTDKWGPTGLHATFGAAGGQEIGGLAFGLTDLLDLQGNFLAPGTSLSGIQVTGASLDPASFFAVVPEPATFILIALGGTFLRSKNRR